MFDSTLVAGNAAMRETESRWDETHIRMTVFATNEGAQPEAALEKLLR